MGEVVTEANLMQCIKNFLSNLTDDQVDLINKLGNMYCNSITEKMYDTIFDNEILMQRVTDRIKTIAISFIDDVYYETVNLRNIQGVNDFDLEGGLYNCDQIYVRAIKDVLYKKY